MFTTTKGSSHHLNCRISGSSKVLHTDDPRVDTRLATHHQNACDEVDLDQLLQQMSQNGPPHPTESGDRDSATRESAQPQIMTNLQKSLSMNIKLPISEENMNKYRKEAAAASNTKSKTNNNDHLEAPLLFITQTNTGVINT